MNPFENIKLNFSLKGRFLKDLGISVGGGSIAYIIGFLFTPIISRIYDPNDYGIFALFNSVCLNMSLFLSFGYNSAILLPKSKRELMNLTMVIVGATLAFSLVSFLFLFIFKKSILSFFNIAELVDYWYLIPLMALLLQVVNVLQAFNIRLAQFKKDASAKVASIMTGKVYVLTFGLLLRPSFIGLVSGEMILRLLQSVLLTPKRSLKYLSLCLRNISINKVLNVAKSYSSYPLYFMPANWLNLMINQLPIFFLSAYFGNEFTGYFSFATSILSLPMMVIGYSMSQVFFKRAMMIFHDMKQLREVSIKFFILLFGLSVIPFTLIFFFGEFIFSFLLGSKWALSGEYASQIAIFFCLQFMTFPFLSLFRVLRKEKELMLVNLISLLILFVALSIFGKSNPDQFIYSYALTGSLIQIFILLIITLMISKKRNGSL